ncbi:DUF6286 domain-containing protein [Streptomyces goshikiensis]|uniref:DUF6286 domain-containing protein n=1 Tax=Streptomyces goshikiensis TaxID=1942 RepID=UPI002E103120|nr:alkaline shock response membrane anchor protein AmaP [Streptomyces goshikiensis]
MNAATAGLVAGMALGFAVDVVAVRAGRPAAAWRRHLTGELGTRPVDDVWMLTGAAVATAVGLWLIVLALTPGLRHQLPLRTPTPGVRACLDRDGAADLLRDAAMQVPGVSTARIRVRRHRVKARATSDSATSSRSRTTSLPSSRRSATGSPSPALPTSPYGCGDAPTERHPPAPEPTS